MPRILKQQSPQNFSSANSAGFLNKMHASQVRHHSKAQEKNPNHLLQVAQTTKPVDAQAAMHKVEQVERKAAIKAEQTLRNTLSNKAKTETAAQQKAGLFTQNTKARQAEPQSWASWALGSLGW